MKRTLLVVCVVLASLIFNSCDLDDDGPNFHFVALQIVNADLPESFDLNETYRIKISYVVPNSCTYYERIDVTKPELTTRNVAAFGAQRTDQTACPEIAQEQEASFDFVVLYDQPYVFRFWQGEDENGEQQYLEVEVPVN